jgi:hypothetical protein
MCGWGAFTVDTGRRHIWIEQGKDIGKWKSDALKKKRKKKKRILSC